MKVDEYFEIYTGGNSNTTTWSPFAIKEFAEEYSKMVLKEYGDIGKFTPKEIKHLTYKVHKAIIKPNFKEILEEKFGKEEYNDVRDGGFFKKYAGKEVHVHKWLGDWWILEDNNYPITQECFMVEVPF